MSAKPTYEELEQRVKELEQEKREKNLMKETAIYGEGGLTNKIESERNPENFIPEFDLCTIINSLEIQSIMDDFCYLTGMVTAILDLEGNVIEATGWKDLCTKFHRINPKTAKKCTESDLFLAKNLKPGEYVDYRCENGLWDVVTPLYVGTKHLGNIYTGQFFYDDEPVDEVFFVKQAEIYGFDKDAYMDAFQNIPRYSRETIKHLMGFLVKFTTYISRISLAKIELERDITERKRTEEALQESENNYRTLVEESFDGIFIQKGSNIIFVNKRLNEMLGYEKAELIGQNHWVVYHPDYQKLTRERAQTRMRGEAVEPRYEVKLQRKDGSWFYGEINARAITFPSSQESEIQVWIKDIDERKRDEKKLKDNERFLQTLIDAIPAPVFYKDREGKYLGFNRAFETFFGEPNEQMVGKTVFDINPPELAEIYYAKDQELFKSGEAQRYESQWQDAHGKLRDFIFNKAVFCDSKGTVIGLIGVLIDITERKQAEKERGKLQLQLLHAQKMESIGTLAGGIAHDFNNILSSILGYSELALLDLPPEIPLRNKLEAIYTSGIKARELVAQILAFSRKDEQVRSPIELHLAVEDALKLLRHAIPSTIHIQTEIDSNCRIMGDPSRIDQIIMNLCTNAYQAMLATGGILEISLSRTEVGGKAAKLAGIPSGFYGKLIIADTGFGIPAEQLERIFEPYFTTKEKGKGTGLGLAVVHGIVKSHKGAILVKSEVGKGTRFEVYLPLTRDESVAVHKTAKSIARGSEKILLVDDQEDVLQIETEMLEILGYEIKGMISAQEALDHFAGHSDQYDLVITDMTMPDMTGDRLAEQLRNIRSDILIVLATGFSELISREKAESMGIDGFLTKPVQLSDMAEMIRKVIDGKSK